MFNHSPAFTGLFSPSFCFAKTSLTWDTPACVHFPPFFSQSLSNPVLAFAVPTRRDPSGIWVFTHPMAQPSSYCSHGWRPRKSHKRNVPSCLCANAKFWPISSTLISFIVSKYVQVSGCLPVARFRPTNVPQSPSNHASTRTPKPPLGGGYSVGLFHLYIVFPDTQCNIRVIMNIWFSRFMSGILFVLFIVLLKIS